MPETPDQLHARATGALRMPPVEEWETFPFDGEMRPRPLLPPAPVDRRRQGKVARVARAAHDPTRSSCGRTSAGVCTHPHGTVCPSSCLRHVSTTPNRATSPKTLPPSLES